MIGPANAGFDNWPMTRGEQDAADQCRQFIHERLGFIRMNCEAAQIHAEIGDDRAMGYDIRVIVAHVRQMIGAFNELSDLKNGDKTSAARESAVPR